MGIVQVIIDRTSPVNIQGVNLYDRANGGVLIIPAGTVFPATTEPGELFWKTDEVRLYRRNDANTVWEAATSTVGFHATTHISTGADPIPTAVSGGASGLLSGADKARLDSLASGNVTIPIRNETGATLLKGRAVSVVGWHSSDHCCLVEYADKDDPTKRPAVAILQANLADGTTGTATIQGIIEGLVTASFNLTDQLVLGNSGQLVRPPPDNVGFTTGSVQNIGFVSRVHSSDGHVLVSMDGLEVVESEQVLALAGTAGTPGPTNKYVTSQDTRLGTDTLLWGAYGVGTSTTARYLIQGSTRDNAPTARQAFRAARAGVLRNLRVRHNLTGTGGAIAYTLYVNGVATALTTSVNAGSISGEDTTHSVSVFVDDLLEIVVTKPLALTLSPTSITVGVEFTS